MESGHELHHVRLRATSVPMLDKQHADDESWSSPPNRRGMDGQDHREPMSSSWLFLARAMVFCRQAGTQVRCLLLHYFYGLAVSFYACNDH